MSNTFLHIVNFIEYHYTMSKRKDSPMWIKCNKKGKEEDHVNKNWSMYRSPSSFTSINLYEDYLWAQTQLYLDRFTSEYKTQLEIDEELLTNLPVLDDRICELVAQKVPSDIKDVAV